MVISAISPNMTRISGMAVTGTTVDIMDVMVGGGWYLVSGISTRSRSIPILIPMFHRWS
jgi:hypothetical protein